MCYNDFTMKECQNCQNSIRNILAARTESLLKYSAETTFQIGYLCIFREYNNFRFFKK